MLADHRPKLSMRNIAACLCYVFAVGGMIAAFAAPGDREAVRAIAIGIGFGAMGLYLTLGGRIPPDPTLHA
jgi:hypothetical protein